MGTDTPVSPNSSDCSFSPARRTLLLLAGMGALATGLAGVVEPERTEAKKRKRKGKKKKGGKGKGKKGGEGIKGGDSSGAGSNSGGGNGSGTARTEEEKLLDMINNFRAENGRPPLARNGKLDTAALNHSRDMADRGYFSHNTPEGGTPSQRLAAAGYSYSGWGENIYKSAPGNVSAQSAFTSWVNSSGHRDNMLSRNFTQIGIGCATDADGRTLWTNTFGKPA